MPARSSSYYTVDEVLAFPEDGNRYELAYGNSHAQEWADVRRVSLVAEVLSPSTRLHDRFDKRRVYQDREVALCWIIDPESRSAEIWTPEDQAPRRETVALEWHPEGASVPFSMELGRLLGD